MIKNYFALRNKFLVNRKSYRNKLETISKEQDSALDDALRFIDLEQLRIATIRSF